MAPTFMVHEHAIFGRQYEKKTVLEFLLSADATYPHHPDVISLIGLGGVGKTTLARDVYIDEKIQQWFDVKAWVHVSEEFHAFGIMKKIIENSHPISGDQNILLQLKEKLEGKRYLIVFDDVWNDNPAEWDSVLEQLKAVGSAKGSKIIITTRNTSVAHAAGAVESLFLGGLSEEECWSLFTHYAFGDTNFTAILPELEIGKEMVKNCGGLPLAVKTLGCFLRCMKDVEAWEDISNISNDDYDYTNDVVRVLKLSYDNLPCHLKHCFASCATFPRGHEFSQEDLVNSWVGRGLIHPEENRTVEEVASDYFEVLASRSFFLQSIRSPSCFVMHDLVYDFVMRVSQERFSCRDDSPVRSNAQVAFERGITLINLIVEILLITFDQIASPKKPQYALMALVASLAALLTCAIELVDKRRKHFKRQGSGCRVCYPSSSEKPYNRIDVFVLISAIAQLIFSSVAYSFLRRGSDNPIKVSLASIIFIICMASSKFAKTPSPSSLPIYMENYYVVS